MIRDILKMGDPRLLRVAPPVAAERFGSAELHGLIQDMFDTMATAGGVGLAAPQIGEDLQLMVFGFERNARYPEAAPVPLQVLINPRIEVLDAREELGWEGCLSIPGLRGEVPRPRRIATAAWMAMAAPSTRKPRVFTHGWSCTNTITSSAASILRGSRISPVSALPRCCSPS